MRPKLQCISYTSEISTRVSACIFFRLLKPSFILQGLQFDFSWGNLEPHSGSLGCLTSLRQEKVGQIRADHHSFMVSCCLSVSTVIRELKEGWRRENPLPNPHSFCPPPFSHLCFLDSRILSMNSLWLKISYSSAYISTQSSLFHSKCNRHCQVQCSDKKKVVANNFFKKILSINHGFHDRKKNIPTLLL